MTVPQPVSGLFRASSTEIAGIGGGVQVNVENMLTIHAARREKAGERCRQLVIDQKLHNAWRTVWSA